MKTKLGVIIIVLLTGIILGAAQPAMLYAGAEVGDNSTLWDPFVNLNPLKGKVAKLTGPLSIYYFVDQNLPGCSNGQDQTIMFYTVRLSSGSNIYTYEGSATGCLGDIGIPGSNGQGDVIMTFLGSVVSGIFPNASGWPVQQGWNLTSVGSPGMGFTNTSYAFVADLSIEVAQSKK